ncbi:MAG: hypothetical protein OEW40_17000 [Cyclobacteriaceae bacterium]|nr:hypothetical protein [Cyclobacteriaceae bacterium]
MCHRYAEAVPGVACYSGADRNPFRGHYGYNDTTMVWHLRVVMHKENDPNVPYFGIKHEGSPIQRDPRYINMTEEIGLWW